MVIMKKFFTFIFLCFLIFLCSCESKRVISYYNSYFRFDSKNREFSIETGYSLSENNPYDRIETENGYDMVFHFEKVGD